MRIAINTRLLLKDRLEGIGWFTYEVVSRICRAHPEHVFYLLFDRKYDPSFVFADNIIPIVIGPQARHPILYKLWFDYRIPPILKKHKIDVFLSPDGFLSLRTKVPQISVIHDLNFEYYPADLPPKDSNYYRRNFPKFAKKADKIITVSSSSRDTIAAHYDIPLNKIVVAYNGVSPQFLPLDEKKKIECRKQYADGNEYFIYIGSLHKRKNIIRMLRAFDAFKTTIASDLKLVIVGDKMFRYKELEQAFKTMKHKDEVIFTGRFSQDKIVPILGAAKAMVYISYFEGFGIPIVEAMKSGVPVITSNVTSLPEVASGACHLVDPFNEDEIASGMEQLMNDEYCDSLITKGIVRAKYFNWDKTANQVWNVIEGCIS